MPERREKSDSSAKPNQAELLQPRATPALAFAAYLALRCKRLDVTVLRSGVPDSVPGRSLNLGAGGVAAYWQERCSRAKW